MRRGIRQIRDKIRKEEYDLTIHARNEMEADNLTLLDVEVAILNGQIRRRERDFLRRTKYVIEGISLDGRPVGIVGRFTETDFFLIITVYEIIGEG
jgi:hypothetical protein